jgi:hypothetical protein
VADDGCAQASSIARRYAIGKEHLGMGALTGARNFECRRYTEFIAGLHERPRIIPSFRLVKIDGQEVATVDLQQRIVANRVITGQVLVYHRIG